MFYEANVNMINSIEAYYYLGMVCARQGKLETAISHYKYALFCEPDHYQSLVNLGSLLIIRGRFNEGMHYFHTALEAFTQHRAKNMLHDEESSAMAAPGSKSNKASSSGMFGSISEYVFGAASVELDPSVVTEAVIRSYLAHTKMSRGQLAIWIVDFVIICLHGEFFGHVGMSGHEEPIEMKPEVLNLRWFLEDTEIFGEESHLDLGTRLQQLGLWSDSIHHLSTRAVIEHDLFDASAREEMAVREGPYPHLPKTYDFVVHRRSANKLRSLLSVPLVTKSMQEVEDAIHNIDLELSTILELGMLNVQSSFDMDETNLIVAGATIPIFPFLMKGNTLSTMKKLEEIFSILVPELKFVSSYATSYHERQQQLLKYEASDRRRPRASVVSVEMDPVDLSDHVSVEDGLELSDEDMDDNNAHVEKDKRDNSVAAAAAAIDAAVGPPDATGRETVRIGFVGAHFWECEIGRMAVGLLEVLPKEKYTVVALGFPTPMDRLTRRVMARADESMALSLNRTQARMKAAAAKLDIIVFIDAMMSPLTYFLAHARIAPLQMALWFGSTQSPGLPSLDYIISLDDFFLHNMDWSHCKYEIESNGTLANNVRNMNTPRASNGFVSFRRWAGGREPTHSEQVVRLDSISNFINGLYDNENAYPASAKVKAPTAVVAATTDSTMDIRIRFLLQHTRIYLVVCQIKALQPEFDLAIKAVLSGDLGGTVVIAFERPVVAGNTSQSQPKMWRDDLLWDPFPAFWVHTLLARLKNSLSSSEGAFQRVRILGGIPKDQIQDLIRAADVMLDPYPFGNLPSVVHSFQLGTPIVTLPNAQIAGMRYVAAFYKQLLHAAIPHRDDESCPIVSELITSTIGEYAMVAMKIASNVEYRDELNSKLIAYSRVLFKMGTLEAGSGGGGDEDESTTRATHAEYRKSAHSDWLGFLDRVL
jgi:tetratricopeptide (TPR) repeat protein